jgi:hypothetical protein
LEAGEDPALRETQAHGGEAAHDDDQHDSDEPQRKI